MLRLRSCASSTMMVSERRRSGSRSISARSTPSVTTRTKDRSVVRSSKRTLKPTVSPRFVPSSVAMRAATLRAAMRRGWVMVMTPSIPRPASRQIFGSWVVLPEPVSPLTMTTWLAASASRIRSRACATGRSSG